MVPGDQLRQLFLDFFRERGHQGVLSSSLIPAGDPTLLLTTAGMVQFKPYFTGEMTPPNPRLTSVQKCFRATDIDQVGDATHLTFFEMLGNFSVGDYFKREAIAWALEFITSPTGGLGLPRERFAITVFQDDDEAFELWRQVGIPEERIFRFGEEDNWWGPAGEEGPCGPCSELHYDFGAQEGCGQLDCGPNCTNTTSTGGRCNRFVEIWNLVFMQYYQDREGVRTPLPKPNIDTGMGLERTAVVMQGVRSVYETDLFQPIIERVCQLSGKQYGQDAETDVALRVVAEHARSAAFLIADGVTPGNEGRGYVLRRVIRRALRYARKLVLSSAEGLGLAEGRLLPEVAEVVIVRMGQVFPELAEKQRYVLETLELEEERFGEVYETGGNILSSLMDRSARSEMKEVAAAIANLGPSLWAGSDQTIRQRLDPELAQFQSRRGAWFIVYWIRRRFEEKPINAWAQDVSQFLQANWANSITGYEAAYLYDTYGFPLEETQEIAREHGLEVDVQGFEKEMEAQRQRGRVAAHFGGESDQTQLYESLGIGATQFSGYETLSTQSEVLALLKDGDQVKAASAGDRVEVVVNETPFYAEGGGQVGDQGELRGPQGVVRVEDTQAPRMGLIVHYGVVVEGAIAVGEAVQAEVDAQHREDCARNHTATHLLHAALREVLGPHVRQAGSLVAPDRLRFDFTHLAPVSRDELVEVQRLVNDKVRQNVPVTKQETTYAQAISEGALAFFGERYGDRVRVIGVNSVKPFSLEVCGGTHVAATGEVGHFQVLWEGSIGSGMRRVEAVTGRGAERVIWERLHTLETVARRLQATPQEADTRVTAVLEELDQVQKRVASLERELARREVASLPDQAREVKGLKVLAAQVSASSSDALRETGDWLRDRMGGGVVALGAVVNDQPTIVVMASAEAVRRGVHAGNLAREVAQEMKGGGGGRPELGQAGGKQKEKLDAALERVYQVVEQEVTG